MSNQRTSKRPDGAGARTAVRLEVVAMISALITIPTYAFSSGYLQYLGYPTIRAVNLADMVTLALTMLPVLIVFIVPAIVAYLHFVDRAPARWRYAPVLALWAVLSAILYLALMFDTAPLELTRLNAGKLIGAIGASGVLAATLHVFKRDLRRGDFGGIDRSAFFVAAVTLSLYATGYTKALSDYWMAPRWSINGKQTALIFIRRPGLCIYRTEAAREPTIANDCGVVTAGEDIGRACFAWAPSSGQIPDAGACERRSRGGAGATSHH